MTIQEIATYTAKQGQKHIQCKRYSIDGVIYESQRLSNGLQWYRKNGASWAKCASPLETERLTANRWRLVSPAGQYAGLDGLRAALVNREQAQVFDGRDSVTLKSKFYGMLLGVQFSQEVESCAS